MRKRFISPNKKTVTQIVQEIRASAKTRAVKHKKVVTNLAITFVYPYYDNKQMFEIHQRVWRKYREEVRNRIHFVVVDDCSPNYPAVNCLLPDNSLDIKIFRISKNLIWNWEAARNIGLHEARTKWVFVSDIDHVVPEDTAIWLLDNYKTMNGSRYTTFNRINIDGSQHHPHPNTYFMTKDLFWMAGGYDEEPNILTGGVYGNDGPFRRWLDRVSNGNEHLDKVSIVRYTTKDISDAACDFLPRKEERDEETWRMLIKLASKKFKKNIPATTLSFKYERVFPIGRQIADSDMEMGE